MPKNYKIYSVRDKGEKKVIKKDKIFDVPFRLLLVGKSQSGKGVVATNMILLDDYYAKDFAGENIFIFSKSLNYDYKTKLLIKQKTIPSENLFLGLDDESLKAVIDFIQEEYEEAEIEGKKPVQSLIILDDVLEDLKEKDRNSSVNDLFSRGRHLNISTMVFLQYYSKLPSVSRTNANGLVIFEMPKRQMDVIADEHNYLENPKDFYKLYQNATKDKHSFMVINYTNDRDNRYLNKNFEPIEL